MRELVLVVSDLYVPADARDVPSTAGLDTLARFGAVAPIGGDWRSWLVQVLGMPELVRMPAAALLAPHSADAAWMATPVHLQAAIDHVRMDGHAVLTLATNEIETLARDFAATFAGSGLALHGLEDGTFALTGLVARDVRTHEPARALGGDVAPWLASGPGAPRLRALTSELELWLHAHSVNQVRGRERRRPITALWLWGGGSPADGPPAALPSVRATSPQARELPMLFAHDAWTRAVWRRFGRAEPAPLEALDAWLAAPRGSAVAVVQLFREPGLGGLVGFDARVLSPVLAALGDGHLDRLRFVANDCSATLGRRDRLRFWRRPRAMFGVAAPR